MSEVLAHTCGLNAATRTPILRGDAEWFARLLFVDALWFAERHPWAEASEVTPWAAASEVTPWAAASEVTIDKRPAVTRRGDPALAHHRNDFIQRQIPLSATPHNGRVRLQRRMLPPLGLAAMLPVSFSAASI